MNEEIPDEALEDQIIAILNSRLQWTGFDSFPNDEITESVHNHTIVREDDRDRILAQEIIALVRSHETRLPPEDVMLLTRPQANESYSECQYEPRGSIGGRPDESRH